MLENLIVKYLMKTISLMEHEELQKQIEEDEETRSLFVEYKNLWVLAGLVIEKQEVTK